MNQRNMLMIAAIGLILAVGFVQIIAMTNYAAWGSMQRMQWNNSSSGQSGCQMNSQDMMSGPSVGQHQMQNQMMGMQHHQQCRTQP